MATAKDVERLRSAIERVGGLLLPADLHRVLGVSPQRAHKLRAHDDFPEPVSVTTDGRPIWTHAEIVKWDGARSRARGS